MSALTGQNKNQIRVAVTGKVYIAPVGTAAPTASTSTLDPAFQELGFTDDTGVTLSKKDTFVDITVWQSTAVARKVPKTREVDLKFVLQQINSVTIPLYTSGGNVTNGTGAGEYTFAVDETLQAYERAVVIDAIDGATVYRFYLPDAVVTDTADVPLNRSKNMGLGITMQALVPPTGTDLYQVFSNDANLVF